jgi:argininosuccinate synthase
VADLGQQDEKLEIVRERLLACGAAEVVIVASKEEMARAGLQVIQAQARYEGGYWNTTGIARHITVQILLPKLKEKGIAIFSHGATGRGNDQVRFQLATNMLAPEIEIYAPWRDPTFLTSFGGRKEMIEYCKDHNLPIKASLEKPYSTDANLLGLTHEAGRLELLTTAAWFVQPEMGLLPKDAKDEEEIVTVSFSEGVPISIKVQGSRFKVQSSLVEIFQKANEVAGRNGIGIGLSVVENRFVGIKSRGVYEAPGMELLGQCYEYLLQLILDRRAREFFDYISRQIARQIYQGYWFDTATQMMRAALGPITRLVSGTIVVRLYKGQIIFDQAKDIPHSLYSAQTASMEKQGEFSHQDSEGFLKVLSLNAKALASTGQIDLR